MRVTVTVTGTKDEITRFKKLGDKLTDFSTAMREIKNTLKTYYSKMVFGSEGAILGDRWAALSPVYRKWKTKHYPGRGILVASGRLERGVRGVSSRNSATIDNPTPYFEYLQLGTKRMKPRPMLAVNRDVTDTVGNIIEKDIAGKLGAA